MKTIITVTLTFAASLIFSACTKINDQTTKQVPTSPTITASPAPEAYAPTDPLELFLVELTQATKLPFEQPVKADIFWNEGESPSTLKVFFGDSYLINLAAIGPNDEATIADYFAANGFAKMKFNESVGEDSHKVGYRKDDLICKYDRSQYPDETEPHLVIYCTDATKGTERK
jgi:hypothetical protein